MTVGRLVRRLGRITLAVPLALIAAEIAVAGHASSRQVLRPEGGQASAAGRWSGGITLPAAELKIVVWLEEQAGIWSGAIDIPAQSVSAMPLTDVRVTGAEVSFALPGVPGSPAFKGSVSGDGATLSGTFTQAGQTFPFQLKRSDAAKDAAGALDDLDALVTGAMKSWSVPGLALAIVKDGEVVVAKGYGVRNVKAGTPVTADTLFAIGSSTKAFTTAALAALVDAGELAWDEPVRKYLPGFKMHDPFATERMTPRDLVTHRSGLPRHDLTWYNAKLSRAELVERIRYLQPNADLRTKFQYQNLMYLTAGYLVEQVGGTSWEDVLATRIFKPLGMTHTNFSVIESQKAPDFATPYTLNDKAILEIPFRDITTVGPAGSINSTVSDMAKWVRLHLGRGTIGDRQVVSARQIDEMHRAQMVIDSFPGLFTDSEVQQPCYGLGWFIESYRGRKHVHHGGNIDGFSALVSLMPGDSFGTVVLTNLNGTPLPTIVARYVSDRLLGLEPIDWNGRFLKRREVAEKAGEAAKKAAGEDRTMGTAPAHPLDQYAGEYDHPAYGALTVVRDAESFKAAFHDIPIRLRHWHYETFRGEVEDTAFAEAKLFFQFMTNQQGEVDRVTVPLEPLVDAIVFAKRPPARLTDPAFLRGLTGAYAMTDNPEFRMTVTLSGTVVTLTVPGQAPRELEPAYGTTFRLKGLTGFTVRFEVDDEDRATGVKLSQPNGVYNLKRVSPSS